MTKFQPALLLCLLAVAGVAASGCHLIKRSKQPKENPAIAAGVEAEFKQRWITHRISELTATGVDAVAAQQQAEAEFRDRYAYLDDTKK